MKLSNDARLPNTDDVRSLKKRLYELVRDIVGLLNGVAEGRISACTNAATAPPATGTYAPGDFVRNSAPQELGPPGAKFIVDGWVCVAAPLTFVQKRNFTGN
ncbi:MAG TPA: hypothetical protein DDZ22_06895 [Massilia sp.]|nr:hypothetical protein [Massilia sp.]